MAEKEQEEHADEMEGVYSEKSREELLEDDEIKDWEEGFMEGADMDGQLGKCANCGDILNEQCDEKEFDGKVIRFCCATCLENYEAKHEEA